MSTLLEPQTTPTATRTDFGRQLQAETAAARISFHWFGARKSLSADQKSQAAETFGAEKGVLTAGKKLLDTRHPTWRELTGVRSRILNYWKGISLPYPEPGLRLIRRETIESFQRQMEGFRRDLREAAWRLDEHYAQLRDDARWRLGRLYRAEDYPTSLSGEFSVEWDFPSVTPPDYLRQLHPGLYRQECERIRGRFDEAVRMAEEAFLAELEKLVGHLSDRLQGDDGDRPKVFRDSAVTNLREFFDRFRQLNLHSDAQLDAMVQQVEGILQGVGPSTLRRDGSLRKQVGKQLDAVRESLDRWLVDRPRRSVMRKPR